MTNLIATIQNQSIFESTWSQVLNLWDNPESQPILIGGLIAGVILGLILGLLLTPLCRSVWLAIKPRSITKATAAKPARRQQ